jgi:hypothetical protein
MMEPERLVVIDESGVHTGMTRRYARAAKNMEAYDAAPVNHGKPTSVISPVRFDSSAGHIGSGDWRGIQEIY